MSKMTSQNSRKTRNKMTEDINRLNIVVNQHNKYHKLTNILIDIIAEEVGITPEKIKKKLEERKKREKNVSDKN